MPAQHKYNKYDSKKRYSSSSSSSSYHRKDKQRKDYHNDKWRKKSRSRSHSNQKHQNKYKISYQKDKDLKRYINKSYEKRGDGYRRRNSQEDRQRDQKKNVFRYGRNDQRDRAYQQHKREQKRQKAVQSKRYVSSSSKSFSKSPKKNRDTNRYNDNKLIYIKKNENKPFFQQENIDKKQFEYSKFKFQNKQEIKQQKDQNYSKNIQIEKSGRFNDKMQRQENEDRFQIKPKLGIMRPPFPPPPPPNINHKFNEDDQRKFVFQAKKKIEFQPRKEDFKREEKEIPTKQQQRKQQTEQKTQSKLIQKLIQKQITQSQLPKLTPIRRYNQIKKQLKNEIIMIEVPKQKVSPFDMVLNEAKANLVLPMPPVNFICIDTFKNMNKFQIQTLDRIWAHNLKQELQKPQNIKQLIQSLPEVTQQQKKESRLWTYLKQQRNEQQHNLKIKLDELRLINLGLSEMVRKLHVLQS